MKHIPDPDFIPEDKVTIIAIEYQATVERIAYAFGWWEYLCIYWHNAERREVWVTRHEIKGA